jgi:hypothetical protein
MSRAPRFAATADRLENNRAAPAAKANMSRAPRLAADAARLEDNTVSAAAKPNTSRAPRFATGATRRARDPANSGPLLRMILAHDSAFLAVSRAADSVQRRIVRTPRFAGGAARRAPSPTAYVADSRLSGQRRRTNATRRARPARTARPTFLAVQPELFSPARSALPRPAGIPASDGWRRAQAAYVVPRARSQRAKSRRVTKVRPCQTTPSALAWEGAGKRAWVSKAAIPMTIVADTNRATTASFTPPKCRTRSQQCQGPS